MSQEVMIAGALFSDVPSIRVPDSQGNFHPFTDVSDTTAAAADVATGKYFYAADGTRTAGTSSGGGGASNMVQGTFTTGSTRNTTQTVTLGYTGSGYPVALVVYVKDGMFNSHGDTVWYNSKNQYDVGAYYMTKSQADVAPSYRTGMGDSNGVAVAIHKNSTTSNVSYTSVQSVNAYAYGAQKPSSGHGCCAIHSSIEFEVYVGNLASNKIGFAPDTEYSYIVVYSE